MRRSYASGIRRTAIKSGFSLSSVIDLDDTSTAVRNATNTRPPASPLMDWGTAGGYKNFGPQNYAEGENPLENKRIFCVLWRNPSTKMHKTWNGHGTLELTSGGATLKDHTGKTMGSLANFKEEKLYNAKLLHICGKEIELQEELKTLEECVAQRKQEISYWIDSFDDSNSNYDVNRPQKPFILKAPKVGSKSKGGRVKHNINFITGLASLKQSKQEKAYCANDFNRSTIKYDTRDNDTNKSPIIKEFEEWRHDLDCVKGPDEVQTKITNDWMGEENYDDYKSKVLKTDESILEPHKLAKLHNYEKLDINCDLSRSIKHNIDGEMQKNFHHEALHENIKVESDAEKIKPIGFFSSEISSSNRIKINDETLDRKININKALASTASDKKFSLNGQERACDFGEGIYLESQYKEDKQQKSYCEEIPYEDHTNFLFDSTASSSAYLLHTSNSVLKQTDYICMIKPSALQGKALRVCLDYSLRSVSKIPDKDIIQIALAICDHPATLHQKCDFNERSELMQLLQAYLPPCHKLGICDSGKMERVHLMIGELVVKRNEKCIIIADRPGTISFLKSYCLSQQINHICIDNQYEAKAFNKSQSKIIGLILTEKLPKLSLIECKFMILYNCGISHSEVGRRLTTKYSTTIYKLITTGCVEERIFQLHLHIFKSYSAAVLLNLDVVETHKLIGKQNQVLRGWTYWKPPYSLNFLKKEGLGPELESLSYVFWKEVKAAHHQ